MIHDSIKITGTRLWKQSEIGFPWLWQVEYTKGRMQKSWI